MMLCSLHGGSDCRYLDALFSAVRWSLPNTVRALLEAGTAACASADGQSKSSEDEPLAAMFCARGGDHQSAESLALNQAFYDQPRAFNIKLVDCFPERIWEYPQVDDENFRRYTPLHSAVVTGKLHIAEKILKRGADVRARTRIAKEPLQCALGSHTLLIDDTRLQAARLLLRYGADPNCSDLEGNLAINDAALFGGRNVLELLIENGGNPHASNKEGRGPLHYARDADTVNYLLEQQVDPFMTDYGGRIALHTISSLGHLSAVEALLPICDADVRDNQGVTALHLAAGFGHVPVVKALLTKIDDVDIVDSLGCTPLHFAAMTNPEIKIADVSSVNMESESVESVSSAQLAVATLLLKRGADPNKHTFAEDVLNHTLGNESTEDWGLALTPDRRSSEEVVLENVSNQTFDNGNSDEIVLPDVFNQTSDNEGSSETETSLHTVDRICYGEIEGCTPLHCAVDRSKIDMAHLLLKHNAFIDSTDAVGRTALHLASRRCDPELVKFLLDEGADPSALDCKQRAPLHYVFFWRTSFRDATEKPHEVVRLLLERKANIEQEDAEGHSALYLALLEGDSKIVQVLLGHGANPLNLSHGKEGPLCVFLKKNSLDTHIIIKSLLIAGEDPNIQDEEGNAPLHIAARKGKVEEARILLEFNANVDQKNPAGLTPLHLAITYGHRDLINLLLDHGANPLALDNENQEPINYVFESGLCDYELVKRLVNMGANINRPDESEMSPLHHAAKRRLFDMVKFLLQHNANVNMKDSTGFTALHHALYAEEPEWDGYSQGAREMEDYVEEIYVEHEREFEIVQLLLKHNAAVDEKDAKGCTPLHLASRNSNQKVVQLLIMYNASIDERDCQGSTALHFAIENADRATVELLLNHGANPLILDNEQQGSVNYVFKRNIWDSALTEILLNAGADPNRVDADGSAPLHHAVRRRECEAVRLLLKHNASVNMKDARGRCPVHLAISPYVFKFNGMRLMRLLLEYNADIEETDAEGRTVLQIASQNEYQGLVDLLVEYGAKRSNEFQEK